MTPIPVEEAFESFKKRAAGLREAYGPFDNGKNQFPSDVATATDAPRIFVEEAKARLEVALAMDRDRVGRRTTCAMIIFMPIRFFPNTLVLAFSRTAR